MLKRITIGVVATVALLFGVYGIMVAAYKNKVKNTTIENITLEAIPDGTYVGYYNLHLVDAKVRVRVQNGRIAGIELLKHRHSEGHSGEAIVARILDEQKVVVDAISGATGSSKAIMKATEIALKKGMK